MQKIYSITTLAVCALTLAACNTIEGFGDDVKHVGAGIERAAHRAGAD